MLRTQQQQHSALMASQANPLAPPSTAPQMPPNNPLSTAPAEIICTRCNLPRHTLTTLHATPTTLPSGERKKYCLKRPWQSTPGADIYGIPFPSSSSNAKKSKNNTKSADTPPGDLPAAAVNGKKDSGIQYFKCTSCDNDKVASTRFAAHLEKCLGLSGRRSGRAAMQKLNGGSGTGSPALFPTDSIKVASRRPSPEKSGKPSPAPEPIVNTAPVPPLHPTQQQGTPKKKKKPLLHAGDEDTPLISATSSNAPPKKRKRKIDVEGTNIDGPKKPKLGSQTPSFSGIVPGSPGLPKKPKTGTPKKVAAAAGGVGHGSPLKKMKKLPKKPGVGMKQPPGSSATVEVQGGVARKGVSG